MDGPAKQAKIFLSYSRKDRETVARLSDALEAKGFDVFRDTEDILPTEEWKGRLESLIAAADTVVFALSPASAGSAVCAWEAEHAGTLNKRIAPVVIADVEGQVIPPSLSKLNYIFMTGRDDFERALANLVTSLNTDIGWIREHTRLGELARRWQDARKPDRALLRGEDIAEAERWRDRRPTEAPALTELHLAYISGSRHAATRGQRRTIGIALGIAALSMVLAGFAYLQRNTAVAERNQALTTQSRFLSDLSQQRRKEFDYTTATLLALAGLPDADSNDAAQRNRPPLVDTVTALSNSAPHMREVAEFSNDARDQAFSPDGRILVTAEEKTTVLRDGKTGRELKRLAKDTSDQESAAFSPDGRRLVVSNDDRGVGLWNVATGEKIADLPGHDDDVEVMVFSRDGTRLLTGRGGGFGKSFNLWNGVDGTLIKAGLTDGEAVAFLGDGTIVMTAGNRATLWNASDGSLVSDFSASGGHASVAVASPDGLRVLTWGKYGSMFQSGDVVQIDWRGASPIVALWDAKSGQQQAVLTGLAGKIEKAAFSRDGKRLLVTSSDKKASVWDAETGKEIIALPPTDIDTAVLDPSGSQVLTASGENISAWDVASGQQTLAYHIGEPVTELLFGPDGKTLLAKGQTAWRFWRSFITSSEMTFEASVPDSSEAVLSADWSIMAAAQQGNLTKVWNVATGDEIAAVGQNGQAGKPKFSPDGTRLLTGAHYSRVQLWDLDSPRQVRVLRGDDFFASSFAFSPDGNRLVAAYSLENRGARTGGGTREFARIWDVKTGKFHVSLIGHEGIVWDVAYSWDGKRVATASNDGTARIWDAATGTLTSTLKGASETMRAVAFSPHGRRLLTLDDNGTTRLWDVETGTQQFEFVAEFADAKNTPYSRDGSRIVLMTAQRFAVIRDAATGSKIATTVAQPGAMQSVVFSPDAARVITTSYDDKLKETTARIFDARSGAQLVVLAGHQAQVNSAVFSPDGKRALTASGDGTARIWSAETGEVILNLNVGAGAVGGAQFSPDGRIVATIANDVRLWHADTGALIAVDTGHTGLFRQLAFSPDGGQLVTSASDKSIRIMTVPSSTQAMVRQAKSRVPRCLSPNQLSAFFLPPDPPRWCIAERKPPYDSDAWQEWLAARDRGAEIKMPAVRW